MKIWDSTFLRVEKATLSEIVTCPTRIGQSAPLRGVSWNTTFQDIHFEKQESVNIVVSWSLPCRIKQQEYYLETERVCGALRRGWLPQLMFDPGQTAHCPEGIIGSPGLFTVLCTVKIFTIVCTILCTINKNGIIQFYVHFYLQFN